MSDSNGRGSYPNQPYQSVWMSHWKLTSCNKTAEKLICPSNASGNKESGSEKMGDNMRLELEVLKSAKGLGVLESKTSDMINGHLIMGPEIYGKRGIGSFLIEQGQEIGDHMLAAKPVAHLHFKHGKAVGIRSNLHLHSILTRIPSENKDSWRRHEFLDEETSKNPLKWMPTYFSAEATSKPYQETVFGSPPSMPPNHGLKKFEFDDEKSKVSSLIGKASKFSSKCLRTTKRKMLEYEPTPPAGLVCERKQGDPSESHLMKGSSPFLFDLSSTSGDQFSAFNEELLQKIQKHSCFALPSDQYIIPGKIDEEKSFYDSYSLQKFSNCVHKVETTRVCAPAGERTRRNYSGFSPTSHSFLITKNTDVSLPNECDIFSTTKVITNVNGNIPGSQNVFPFYNRGKRGLVLRSLSSSTDSEEKENVDVKTSKVALNDETSTETDTMDVDFFEKNLHSRAKCTASDKVIKLDSNSSSRNDISSREVENQRPHIRLPDINLELPPSPEARSCDSSGPNSSETLSLEMDVLVAHAELSPKPKFNVCSDDSGKEDPSNRWVKRLKLSSSQSSSLDPKSSYLAESMCNKTMKQFMNRILSRVITNSEPTLEKRHGKFVLLDKINQLKDNNPKKGNKDSLLSQTWIQRWLHDGSRISRENRGTICEPQSLRFTPANLQRPEFTSIGAMAIMGKAMRGFQPCELQRQGSFTVWNTKAV